MYSSYSCEKLSDLVMTARRELTYFERGLLVGARRMGHYISEILTEFNIPRQQSQECADNI